MVLLGRSWGRFSLRSYIYTFSLINKWGGGGARAAGGAVVGVARCRRCVECRVHVPPRIYFTLPYAWRVCPRHTSHILSINPRTRCESRLARCTYIDARDHESLDDAIRNTVPYTVRRYGGYGSRGTRAVTRTATGPHRPRPQAGRRAARPVLSRATSHTPWRAHARMASGDS
jgi:hypothetical protein